uniref:CCHC-type domain-containing protein n=1 Tax=Fagus sylvatica TaxID=28930 RepID=A0A2N9HK96_FAGSY
MEGEKMAYKMMNQDFVKLDKFDGSNFIRWQDKMKFLLTALKIFYVLDPNLQPIPNPTPEDTEQLKEQRIKREEDELVCRGHILNTLSDRLYDLFTTMSSPKEIWKALETKYKTEKFLELFQVGAIIAKLPPSWNNYRKKLLHMAERTYLRTDWYTPSNEEESRIREGTNSVSKVNEGTVNYVQNGGIGSSKTNKSFRPNKKIVKKNNSNKDKKGRACFHCGKKGHYIQECRFLKNQMKDKELNTSEANVVDEIVAMVSEMQIGMITEVHMASAAENSSEWWYDSGATIHVCNNKTLFKEYVEAGNGLEVLMGNHNTAKVLGTGTVELILSSGKKLVLTNVYHVPDIKKNLVSASLLSKNGVKAVLESDKLILSKNGVFVGKEGNREKVLNKFPFVGNVEEDPNTYNEAMASRDAAFWREAVNDEMDSILSNNTWVLVDLPPGSNTIGSLASIYKLVVHQMDVKTAFLNGNLDEEVYMDQPEGFVLPGNERKVSNGFKHNGADKCVYSKFTVEYGVIVCLYVDDMLIFGTNMLGVCETKKYLASMFKMKDLNEADTILEVNTPFDSNYKLVENTGRAIAQLEYASAIGSMMYAMHCTRPNVAFAVNRLSRYTSNPSAEHWKAIARVLGYLKKTKDLGLYYSGYPAVLEGYSDANWVTSVGDNKSTSGWIFTLGGGAISWASKKQSCISHSTMESEFIALASAGKEAEWLRNMFYDIELWPQPMPAISIYCDSQATMSKAYSKIYNGKSRHISLRHEYVRQLIEDGVISIVYVKSSSNLADPFTKGLSRDLSLGSPIQLIGCHALGVPGSFCFCLTINPVDWMSCFYLIQSPGLVVQLTGSRQL